MANPAVERLRLLAQIEPILAFAEIDHLINLDASDYIFEGHRVFAYQVHDSIYYGIRSKTFLSMLAL